MVWHMLWVLSKQFNIVDFCQKYANLLDVLRKNITVVYDHVNSDHVPSFSCLDVWTTRQTTSGVYAITVTTSAYHSRKCGKL